MEEELVGAMVGMGEGVGVREEPTQLRAMAEQRERQGKYEAHDVPLRDVERVGEALRLGTTRFWFRPFDLRG